MVRIGKSCINTMSWHDAYKEVKSSTQQKRRLKYCTVSIAEPSQNAAGAERFVENLCRRNQSYHRKV